MTASSESTGLRIGALSKRVGVSAHVLRAWETRYGLFAPDRSAGGYRLYSEDDVRKVRRMKAQLAAGFSAAEAARLVLAEPALTVVPDQAPVQASGQAPGQLADGGAPGTGVSDPETFQTLRRALDDLDERAAQTALDRLFSTLTVEAAVRDVLMPVLSDLGVRWARGEVSIGQEHFASNLVRSRLAALATGWGGGQGKKALLACPPGERHDIALLSFGLVLRRAGWQVTYLGADSPMADVEQAVARVEPDVVVLSAIHPDRFDAIRSDLARLAGTATVALAGPGASAELADEVGAEYLSDDPVTAAERWTKR